MASTKITISSDGGIPVPDIFSVKVVSGDTVSLVSGDGSAAALYFSPDLVKVVSPAPAGRVVLAGADKLEFTFTSSEAGAYTLLLAAQGAPAPGQFPAVTSNLLHINVVMPSTGEGFGGGGAGVRVGS